MPGVKRSHAFLLSLTAFSAAGCSSLELARFAPPGIIKYEDIASKKSPNAAMQDIVEKRRIEGEEKFPILSDMPSRDDLSPVSPPEIRKADIKSLEDARDELAAAVKKSREQSQADRTEVSLLPEQRDVLSDQIEDDAAKAKETRENPISLPDDQ